MVYFISLVEELLENMVLISMLHRDVEISDEELFKPHIILKYNSTKRSVDCLDKLPKKNLKLASSVLLQHAGCVDMSFFDLDGTKPRKLQRRGFIPASLFRNPNGSNRSTRLTVMWKCHQTFQA